MAIDPCASFRLSGRAACARMAGSVNSIDGVGDPKLVWVGDIWIDIVSCEGADLVGRWPFVVEIRTLRGAFDARSHNDGFVRHRRRRVLPTVSPCGELDCRVMDGLNEHSSA